MPVDVLIDGYNLLHAAGLAKSRYGPGELQRRRATLLQKLAALLDPTVQGRTTVVFDSHRSPPDEASPPIAAGGIRILFSPPPLEADDLIEELLAKHSSPKQILVVSSDHRLHKAAKRRGATPIDSDAFLDQLAEEPDERPGRKRPVRRSTVDDAATDQTSAAEQELRKVLGRSDEDSSNLADGGADAADEVNDPAFWEKRISEPRRRPKS